MRATLPAHVYQEKANGVIAHTAASTQLAENAPLRDFLDSSLNECILAICKYPEAMEKWPGSEEANQVVSAPNNNLSSGYSGFPRIQSVIWINVY